MIELVLLESIAVSSEQKPTQQTLPLMYTIFLTMFYTDTREFSKGENSKQESLENIEKCKQDKEMQEWLGSIILQNHLVPSYMTFDNQRHLSMRSKYADMTQIINFCNSIKETKEERQTNSRAPSGNIKGLKKKGKQGIKKNLSHETFNLGLGPTPKLSTRISKDAVKRNKQKDNQLKFHGSRSPPPPKFKPVVNGSNAYKAGVLKNPESKGKPGNKVEGLSQLPSRLSARRMCLRDETFSFVGIACRVSISDADRGNGRITQTQTRLVD